MSNSFDSPHLTQSLQHLRFAGLLMGKALFNGILLDVPFANFFLLKLLAEVAAFFLFASLCLCERA